MTALGVSIVCMFLQVGLTLWSILAMGMARVKAVKAKEVRIGEIALATSAYPKHIQKLQNNAHNQFETPVLMYVGILLAISTSSMNWGIALGAIVFVAMRFAHRIVHVGANHVGHRFNLFCIGLVGLLIIWGSLGLDLSGLL